MLDMCKNFFFLASDWSSKFKLPTVCERLKNCWQLSVRSATRLHLEEESDEAFQEIRNTFALKPCGSWNVIWCGINNHSIVELEWSLCVLWLSLSLSVSRSVNQNYFFGPRSEQLLCLVPFLKHSHLQSLPGHAPNDNGWRCTLKINWASDEFFQVFKALLKIKSGCLRRENCWSHRFLHLWYKRRF